MAASCALERRVAPAMMYSDSDRISRAMNTTSRSEAAASSTMPVSANSSSGNTSGGAWPSACPSSEFSRSPGPSRSAGAPPRGSPDPSAAAISVVRAPTASRTTRA